MAMAITAAPVRAVPPCTSTQLTQTTDLSTGKTALTPGAADTRWTVSDSPDGGPRPAYRVRPVPGAWVSTPLANWISTTGEGSGDASNAPGGFYTYTMTFSLPLLSISALAASVAVDNEATIVLNGTTIFFKPYPGHEALQSFTYSGPSLRPGDNRLDVIVNNISTSPEGVVLGGSVTTCFPAL